MEGRYKIATYAAIPENSLGADDTLV